MNNEDKKEFIRILTNVFALYDKVPTTEIADIWYAALKDYTISEVRKGFTAYVKFSENGQFAPKPADIIKHIEGNAKTLAIGAWGSVTNAIKSFGAYQSIVFDDPLIHAAIAQMGGWVKLCHSTDNEMPHKARDFERIYVAYKQSRAIPDHPKKLCGITECENVRQGHEPEPPILIGDQSKAQAVLSGSMLVRNPVADLLPNLRMGNSNE